MVAFIPRFTGDHEARVDTVTPRVAGIHAVAVALNAAAGDIRAARQPSVDVAALDALLEQTIDALVGRAPARLVGDLGREAAAIENTLSGFYSGETTPIGPLIGRLAGLRQSLAVFRPLLEPTSAEPAA
jgi:hypothetical protein